METVVEQGVLFPMIEQKARPRSALREFMDALEVHGPLMPQAYVQYVIGVSKQRVDQLAVEGRIARVKVRGKWFVPLAALELFLAEERKNGRPVRDLGLVESYREHFKALVKKT